MERILFHTYEIKRVFYLHNIYTFIKSLLIDKTITHQDSVVPKTFYYIKNSKILLTNNVISWNFSFFIFMRTNVDNKPDYKKIKFSNKDLKKFDGTEYCILFQNYSNIKGRVLWWYSIAKRRSIDKNILKIIWSKLRDEQRDNKYNTRDDYVINKKRNLNN